MTLNSPSIVPESCITDPYPMSLLRIPVNSAEPGTSGKILLLPLNL